MLSEAEKSKETGSRCEGRKQTLIRMFPIFVYLTKVTTRTPTSSLSQRKGSSGSAVSEPEGGEGGSRADRLVRFRQFPRNALQSERWGGIQPGDMSSRSWLSYSISSSGGKGEKYRSSHPNGIIGGSRTSIKHPENYLFTCSFNLINLTV